MRESSNILTDALPMPGEGLAAVPRVRDRSAGGVDLAEHSNVTGKALVSSYLRERGAWLLFRRTGISVPQGHRAGTVDAGSRRATIGTDATARTGRDGHCQPGANVFAGVSARDGRSACA
jgi:hypothetical protein